MVTGIELVSSVLAAAATHWVVNGLPIEATYLQSKFPGCSVASARAEAWRKSGKAVLEQRVGSWCVVGTVIDRYWVSEQWGMDSAGSSGAYGWRVRLPLSGGSNPALPARLAWPLDLVDPTIATRIQFRSSLDSLDTHHQKTLALIAGKDQLSAAPSVETSQGNPLRISRLRNGQLVVSGNSVGTRYSVVIQRAQTR